MSDAKTIPKPFRIPDGSLWAQAWKMSAVVAVIGIAVAVAGYVLQSERFCFSYLYAFISVLTLWFGSVFFTLIQHLTAAGWSTSVRRASEFVVSGVVVLPFLALPILTQLDKLYPWWSADHTGVAEAQETQGQAQGTQGQPPGQAQDNTPGRLPEHTVDRRAGADEATREGYPTHPGQAAHAEHAAHGEHGGGHEAIEHEIMASKTWYLNHTFFFIRFALYFAIWLWLGLRLFGYSASQDATGDASYSVRLKSMSPAAMILFALSLTFAGFDWIMSLDPGWYSTMFGVRIFASSAVTSFAVVILITLGWKRAGLVKNEINTEHYHDLGKLMFGFLIFWAYVSFSEFFLIWYAAIPEETVYYHRRWDEPSWRMLSVAIVVLKFIVPFWVAMSRNAKRNNGIIGFAAFWIVAAHFVEMYYWIMPYYHPFKAVQWNGIWLEVGCLMATLGIFLTYVLRKMTAHSLIAVGDPRLPRALNFINQ